MSTVTRLYLIRHGATMLTAEDRFAGATNVELSNEGRAQATALADHLKSVRLEAIYASPLGTMALDIALANADTATGVFAAANRDRPI